MAAIILEGNSQIRFPERMITAALAKTNRKRETFSQPRRTVAVTKPAQYANRRSDEPKFGIVSLVKLTSMFALFSLLPVACVNHDPILPNQIAGTWANESSGTMTIVSNGSFSANWPTPDSANAYEGTWQFTNGILISTITNVIGSNAHARVGLVANFKIIRLDEHKLVYKIGDRTFSLSR